MELLTIIFSGLLSLISPVGLVVDRTAENVIKKQFTQVEELKVRVDNAPTHQLIQGKVEKVRIAGRGLKLKGRDIRIAALEIETDALHVEPRSLTRRQPQLRQPFQSGVRIVIEEADVNKLLQSPEFLSQLGKLNIVNFGSENGETNSIVTFENPRVKFLAKNRVNLKVELRNQKNNESVTVEVETGMKVIAGRQLQLIEPVANVEEEVVPVQLLNQIVTNLNQRFDLQKLEDDGLQARVIKLEVTPSQLEIATFVRILPSSKWLRNSR